MVRLIIDVAKTVTLSVMKEEQIVLLTITKGKYHSWLQSKNCIPLPSWSDCREFLREQGYELDKHCDGYLDLTHKLNNDMHVQVYFVDSRTSLPTSMHASTDLECILRVCLQVCEGDKTGESST